MNKTNFYQETIDFLNKYNKTISDVHFVTTSIAQCTIEEFLNKIKILSCINC